jgi:translation initiation factor 1A
VGKRLVKSEGDIRKGMMLPNEFDLLGVVVKNLGQARFSVKGQDGHTRVCRVRGKMKKRRWVREGDVVLVSPWEFDTETRADIIFRYTENQAYWLRNNGYLSVDA